MDPFKTKINQTYSSDYRCRTDRNRPTTRCHWNMGRAANFFDRHASRTSRTADIRVLQSNGHQPHTLLQTGWAARSQSFPLRQRKINFMWYPVERCFHAYNGIDFRWRHCRYGHELPVAGSGRSEWLFPYLWSVHRGTHQVSAASHIYETRAATPADHGEYLLHTCQL